MKYIVDINSENMRLDKFIRKYSEETSLSVLFSLIRKGQIKVNSKKSKENYRLQKGDEIYLPESAKINFESKKNVKIYIIVFLMKIIRMKHSYCLIFR